MVSTADIKNGLVMNFNNDLYKVVDFQHVKPGKGPAFVRTKLKSVRTGKVITNTFSSGHKIDDQRVERRGYQFLYKEGEDDFHFMNTETYEQIYITGSIITSPQFMKEGQVVEILFHAETEEALDCEMPAFVVLQITYTEPGEKGNTATNAMKDATVETGANIRVPLFINNEESIKIDTRTGAYSERVR